MTPASITALVTLLGVATPCFAADRAAHAKPIAHFLFCGLEREKIRDASFLETPTIAGAQLKYTWRELEPERDRYDLQALSRDLQLLDRHGKRLFVQLQDVSFSPEIVNVPQYLQEDIYLTHSGSSSAVVTVYTATRQNPLPDYLTTVEVGDNPFGLAFVPRPGDPWRLAGASPDAGAVWGAKVGAGRDGRIRFLIRGSSPRHQLSPYPKGNSGSYCSSPTLIGC